ncbi:MAG TPA: radical SAM family heme chaperone HemW, partial [Alphaproteobacteria bacterium]|nr:radical SAM family heme chaperone HemW [Alphaproteobacteria bacterium]
MASNLSLYIHWPFCAAKCPYCDFNSHVRERVDEARFGEALLREMRHWHEQLGARRLTTIFFGGGTPSLMPPALVEKLIEQAQRLWPTADDVEITLEANPTSSEAGKFAALRQAGVNRLSLGIQALNDEALRFLGRRHDVKQALTALEAAAKTFPRWSFDLIYARKGQNAKDWEKELRQALGYAGEHLSLYQLTLEPNTGFAARAATGEVFQPPEEEQAELFELTQNVMEEAGLPAYEISNHARAGQECRHNLAYWNYAEYVGLGPGAHGRVGFPRAATLNRRAPEAWLKAVEEKGEGLESLTPLTPREMREEALLMGLRLLGGLDKKQWREKFGE